MKTQNIDIPKETIAREREATDRQKREIEVEIKALILGTQAIELLEAQGDGL